VNSKDRKFVRMSLRSMGFERVLMTPEIGPGVYTETFASTIGDVITISWSVRADAPAPKGKP
jgi:hypothetical protein